MAAIALAVVALGAGTAPAAPAGPRLAVSVLGPSGKTRLTTVGPGGEATAVVYRKNSLKLPRIYPFLAASWAPDGSRLAATVVTGQHHDRYATYPETAIALVGADGGPLELVPGTSSGSSPVFSPDGTRIAYAKSRSRRKPNGQGGADEIYASASIWMLNLASGRRTQLTPWRNHLLQVPSSFAPDGSRLAFTREVGSKPPEALAMEFNGSADTVLARNALEPVYSPDGSRIAFLRGPVKERHEGGSFTWARMTDLYSVSSEGGGLVRLTATRNVVELAPSWDPSGMRIAYSALRPFASEDSVLGFGDEIRQVNADGTCSTRVLGDGRSAFYGSAWQPGPGREAGPISC